MRIDLNVPYGNKDEAKRLGAWWDAARRTWYVKDIEDLTPFMRWIRKAQDSRHEVDHNPLSAKHQKHRQKKMEKMLGGSITVSSILVPHCGCFDMPPWEDCEHSFAPTDLDAEADRLLKSF